MRFRFLVAALVLGGSVGIGSFLPRLEADNSTKSFLNANDPTRVDYDRFLEQFGQDVRIILLIRPPQIFDLDFLAHLRRVHEEIESEVPHLTEVKSLWNARNTRGEGDQLIVGDLMEEWPETQADLDALEARVRETPSYLNTLVDEDLTLTAITLEPFIYSARGAYESAERALSGFQGEGGEDAEPPETLSETEIDEIIDATREIIRRHESPDFEMWMAGGPVANRAATEAMARDVIVFLTWGSAVMAVLLFVLFRRVSAVILTLLVVLTTVVVTYGVMALLEIPTSIAIQVLPVLLLCVVTCSAVHILTIVFQRLSEGESQGDAIAHALGHSGLAVLMAAATTAGGMLSFVSADLAQIRNLGLVAPIGVFLSFFFSVTLLPAFLAIVPLRPSRLGADAIQQRLGAALAVVGRAGTSRPYHVLGGAALLVAIGGFGVAQLEFSQAGLEWFPPDDPTRMATEFLDEEFSGASGMEVWIETGRENALHDPELLQRLDRAVEFASGITEGGGEMYVGKVVSLVDVVKETHKALNGNDPAYYAIPDDPALVAQELLLFENSGSDDLEHLVDSLFSMTRVSLRTPFVDALLYVPMIDRLRQGFQEILGPDVEIRVTGLGSLFGRTWSVMNVTMARSYGIALLIITPLMVLLIGEWKRGLISMVPNLVPIWLTLGLMGWLGLPIDNSSLLIGCILIGLAVDDTIHFMHKFRQYYSASGEVDQAVRQTLLTTGSALLFTSLILTGGFLVQALAYMDNIATFGQLCAFAAIVAFLSNVLMTPALMSLVTRREKRVGAGAGERSLPLDPAA